MPCVAQQQRHRRRPLSSGSVVTGSSLQRQDTDGPMVPSMGSVQQSVQVLKKRGIDGDGHPGASLSGRRELLNRVLRGNTRTVRSIPYFLHRVAKACRVVSE